VRFEKDIEVNVGFILTEWIDCHSAKCQPSEEDEKLPNKINFESTEL
jgi:hypothetical protein